MESPTSGEAASVVSTHPARLCVVGTAFVLGGTGFIGRRIARRFADSGWDVTIGSRGVQPLPDELRGLKHTPVDRSRPGSLVEALRPGVDVLVDVIPYEIGDAEQLVSLGDRIGSIVAISSASVYADASGRTLDEATGKADFPEMPVPIPERQPRAVPGDATYSTKKAGIEDVLLRQDRIPATIIRPCAIYGPGATHCREWFFVKRVLDRRRQVPLAYEGDSVFHTTAVDNLAELVFLAAHRPGTRALNCADPDPPSVRKIATAIAGVLHHEWDLLPVSSELSAQPFLENPWGTPRPWVLDMTQAHTDLGYKAVTTYDEAIVPAIKSIVEVANRRGPHAFAHAIPYIERAFDYPAEDAFIERHGLGPA